MKTSTVAATALGLDPQWLRSPEGIAFLTGSVSRVSFWLLEAFPILGQIG